MRKNITIIHLADVEEFPSSPKSNYIVVSDQMSSEKVLLLCQREGVSHIVQKSNFDSENEIRLSEKMLLDPASFNKFPLSTIFGSEDPCDETESKHAMISELISSPSQKYDVIAKIEDFVVQHASPKSLFTDVTMVADELITNSLYNAPFVDLENSTSGAERDSSKVSVDPNRKPHVFAGKNNEKIVVGCTDFYGRLNIKKLMKRIERCYHETPNELINFGPGGAGIGSFMIFYACICIYISVDPGRSTTVACAFPLHMSARKRHSLPKNIHLIFGESEL